MTKKIINQLLKKFIISVILLILPVFSFSQITTLSIDKWESSSDFNAFKIKKTRNFFRSIKPNSLTLINRSNLISAIIVYDDNNSISKNNNFNLDFGIRLRKKKIDVNFIFEDNKFSYVFEVHHDSLIVSCFNKKDNKLNVLGTYEIFLQKNEDYDFSLIKRNNYLTLKINNDKIFKLIDENAWNISEGMKISIKRKNKIDFFNPFVTLFKDEIKISDINTNLNKIKPKISLFENIEKKTTLIKTSTIVDELAPVVTADGKRIYYVHSSGNPVQQDIWYIEKIAKNKFSTPVELKELNTSISDGVTAVMPNGDLHLFNPYNNMFANGAEAKNNSMKFWDQPVDYFINNYRNLSNKTSKTVSVSNNVLLHTLVSDEGFGFADIYVSFRENSTEWSKPKNIGNVINTTGNEIGVFIAPDDKTLYFTSNGHLGYGKYDVFISKRLDDSWLNWTSPINLGPKINSKDSEIYFVVSGDGLSAYTSATGADGSIDLFYYDLEDIKDFEFIEDIQLISGIVKNDDGEPINDALISYSILNTDKIIGTTSSDLDGNYDISLSSGNEYKLSIDVEGYNTLNKNINLKNLNSFEESTLNFNLSSLSINFEFNSFEIDKKSLKLLDNYISKLKLDAKLELDIEGHTDSWGSAIYNLYLSKMRAFSVKNYFLKNGISSKRLNVSYFGEEKPIFSNSNALNRAKNRRIEILIK